MSLSLDQTDREGDRKRKREERDGERKERQTDRKKERERVPVVTHPRRGLARPPVQSSEAGCTLTQGNSWLSFWSPQVNLLISATPPTS